MAFSSRYESLRKLREISLRKAEQLFMEALGILDQNRMMLKKLDSKRTQSVDSISGQEGSFAQTVSWRALCYDYVHAVSGEMQRVEEVIVKIEGELSQRRCDWQEATKELKKVEHLMEMEFQGQKDLAEQREERVQDDLQMSRWGKSSKLQSVSLSPGKGRDGR
ncbi:MAG: flagellar export protein FliJ [Leptospirillum sp.]|jgi:flagellar export protein FliJ